MSNKGKFIVIEGGEGSGKTSALEYLKNSFSKRGDVIFTREPGGTEISEKIRTVLMDKSNRNMAALTEIFLFCGARAQHVKELIKPALDLGKHVISDRFDASTIAYQLYGREHMDLMEEFQKINFIAKQGLEPNVIIYLDVEPEVGLSRKAKSEEGHCTRFDEEKLYFHKKVREGFWAIYKNINNDSPLAPVWRLVRTTNRAKEIVNSEVLRVVESILNH